VSDVRDLSVAAGLAAVEAGDLSAAEWAGAYTSADDELGAFLWRPDEPPGTRSSAHGLWTGPKAEFSFEEPIANSSMFVLPTTIAPASFKRLIAVASY